jgi:hypothetical protein
VVNKKKKKELWELATLAALKKKKGSQTIVQMYVIKFKAEQCLSCFCFAFLNTGSEENKVMEQHRISGGRLDRFERPSGGGVSQDSQIIGTWGW